MKNYVITIKDNDKSVASAERCIASGAKNGMKIEMFSAITPKDDPMTIMAEEQIPIDNFYEKYSRTENCMAAFLSHYCLWKEATVTQENITIFEHDAVLVDNIPTDLKFDVCVNLGAPSYGRFKTPAFLGVGPLTSKPYFPGAHAYRVTPKGAEQLIHGAKKDPGPTDVFLDIRRFPQLQEKYPWPVECRDSFTTIQNQTGCIAKHNYNESYEIL